MSTRVGVMGQVLPYISQVAVPMGSRLSVGVEAVGGRTHQR